MLTLRRWENPLYTSTSFISLHIQVIRDSNSGTNSDWLGLQWALGPCISNKLLGDTAGAGLWPHFNKVKVLCYSMVFLGGDCGKEPACQCKRCKRHGFYPWIGKIPGGGMATHSSILAWRIPWTEEPGGLLRQLSTHYVTVGCRWYFTFFVSNFIRKRFYSLQ